jgi:hypothetical protein
VAAPEPTSVALMIVGVWFSRANAVWDDRNPWSTRCSGFPGHREAVLHFGHEVFVNTPATLPDRTRQNAGNLEIDTSVFFTSVFCRMLVTASDTF